MFTLALVGKLSRKMKVEKSELRYHVLLERDLCTEPRRMLTGRQLAHRGASE